MSPPADSFHEREEALKFARGVSSPSASGRREVSALEWLTLVHVGVFLIVTTWAFGGQISWIVMPLTWWGSLGALIAFMALRDREAWQDGRLRPLFWLVPFAAFNLLVLIASLNPSFREVRSGSDTLLVNSGGFLWLPSSARPGLALEALWLFDAIWISCFNLALIIRQRRLLRLLLLVMVTNALALAVFGTAQKLAHAPGLFFGAVPSPQAFFFSSFIYHNHWGAFSVLMIAGCLGLIWHYGRRREARDFLHTPATGGIIIVLALAAAVPLSGSRSTTALALLLLAGAFAHGLFRLVQNRRRLRESILPPLLAATVAIAVAAGGIWYVARDSIVARFAKTKEQVAVMQAEGSIGDRAVLYGNTWRMAKDRIWFGWGMASYPHVFMLYNTRQSVDRLPVFYRDAHSDWLQALAEHGVVGSTLLAACALVPLAGIRRRVWRSPLPAYLLSGCGLVLLYAWVEFPFGNVAVVLSWWLCYFAAIQYARLQDRAAATEAAPPLV